MGAYNELDVAIAGLRLGIESLADFIESFRSADVAGNIPYGVGVFMAVGGSPNGYLAHQDTVVLTQSGTFGASNVFTPTLNGVALGAVTYATNNADMYTAIKAEIVAALPAAQVSVTAGSYLITIFNPGYDVTLTGSTAGGSAVTSTPTYSSSMIFMGVTSFDQVSYRDSTGGYPLDVAGNCSYMGQIWVNTSVAVNSGQAAYIIIAAGATQGQFTNVSTNNFVTKGVFRSNTTGAGLALVELRGKSNFAGNL